MMHWRKALFLLLLYGVAMAGDLIPSTEPGEGVRRVSDRRERIDIEFPADGQWREILHQAEKGVETRNFEPGKPELSAGVDLASITILHDRWNVDLEQMQHLFGRKVSAECPGLNGRLWSEAPGRRIVVYNCEDQDPPFSAIQLFLQGRDHLFSVELFSTENLLREGELVRWVDFLDNIQTCDLDDPERRCPKAIWPGEAN